MNRLIPALGLVAALVSSSAAAGLPPEQEDGRQVPPESGPPPAPPTAVEPAAGPPPAQAAAGLALFGDARVRFTGYFDAGIFKAAGDGVAYARDAAKQRHPEYASFPWVFLGDPWSNPINSQGDSADLGLDRTNVPRFDPIHSHGKASFIVNNVNLGVLGSVGDGLLFETSLNFEPRGGTLGSSGDQLDVDLAYVEWIPAHDLDLHLFIGKFESTFGLEYRTRKAPDRFGITPSIISRYTVGPLTGLKMRGSVLSGALTLNAALSNGAPTTEKFAHFFSELAANSGKTLSARLSYRLPTRAFLEVGASGVYGSQAAQPDASRLYRQIGADVRLVLGDLTLQAEALRAIADGGGVADAPFLRSTGWYLEGDYQLLPWLGLLARADQRHAQMFAPPNLYLTETVRGTLALRFDLSANAIAKVEYLRILELDGPDLDDDIVTSSFIFRF